MTKTVERSVYITVPAERVFAYVSDFAKYGEWSAEPVELTPGSSGHTEVGSTFQATYYTERITVTELVPNKTLAFRGAGQMGSITHRFRLEGDDLGTRLVKSYEPEALKFPYNLIASFVRGTGAVKSQLDKELRRIKENLERL